MAGIWPWSQGWAINIVASTTVTVATFLSGVGLP